MRLLRDVPEARAALGSGKLSLSNAAKVQSFRQAEKKLGRQPDPRQLVAQVESLSQRECEKTLFAISPEALPRERERVVSASEERELKIIVSPTLYEKLMRLRGLLAHARPEASYAELLEYMADEELARLEKRKGLTQDSGIALTAAAAVEEKRPLPAGQRVHLPAALKRAVWSRSGGRCELEHAGRRCSSRYRLEVDHIEPLALGGANALANLRLACRHHNAEQARKKLGTHLSRSRARAPVSDSDHSARTRAVGEHAPLGRLYPRAPSALRQFEHPAQTTDAKGGAACARNSRCPVESRKNRKT